MWAALILLFILLVFIGFDLGVSFREWQSRIGIGRWSDRLAWQDALARKARKWLRRAPTVRISDNDRWILWDMLRGRYRSRTIQAWQDAGLLLGLEAEDSARYAARRIDPRSGDWQSKPEHVDAALLAYVLRKNGALAPQAERTVLDLLLALKGDRPTLPYRAALPDVRFVDTIGMTAPFLTLCGMGGVALAQITEYDRALLPGSRIPAHAYDMQKNLPLGVYDWCRGTGWYILGLVESNGGGVNDRRIAALAAELIKHQKPDGGFGAMFFDPGSRFESSGSALAGVLMVHAYRISGDPRMIEAAFAIERRLMAATRRSGALDFCQGDTRGIGYYSRTFSIMPFAQGIALRLSKELNQYADR